MVREVRVYIEGGGDERGGKEKIQQGFSQFLRKVANKQRTNLRVIACGGRDQAFKSFKRALKTNPQAFNILLVDSETIIVDTDTTWEHLKKRDSWNRPPDVGDEQCYLMVQVMEAWFLADKGVLETYYGKGFRINAIPRNTNIEQILKADIEIALESATRNTTKGKYHKIMHASALLPLLNPQIVRSLSPHCERLLKILE